MGDKEETWWLRTGFYDTFWQVHRKTVYKV
jgi:hypothetical protein